ncbi:MAG: hypothetical protein K5634_05645 [Sphaerochaetaceae bacterium]|nr:hypothetical protein [Sphaerochaetaceae bacterium]
MKYPAGTFVQFVLRGTTGYGIIAIPDDGCVYSNAVCAIHEDPSLIDEYSDNLFLNVEDDYLSSVAPLQMPESVMAEYIRCVRFENDFSGYSEEEIKVIYEITEALEKKNIPEALLLKGYSSINGNEIYPEDRSVSLSCLLRAFDILRDPHLASSLGDLYLTLGQAEKALDFYSYAAERGVVEARCSRADMLYSGTGIKQDRDWAIEEYCSLYYETREKFIYSSRVISRFSECALRMASVELDRKYPDLYMVRKYALEAAFSFSYRAISFGDNELEIAISEVMSASFFATSRYTDLRFLSGCFNRKRVTGKAGILSCGDSIMINITCLPVNDSEQTGKGVVLLTVPELDMCTTAREFTILAKSLKNREGEDEFTFDRVLVPADGNLCFYEGKILKASFKAAAWCLKKPL